MLEYVTQKNALVETNGIADQLKKFLGLVNAVNLSGARWGLVKLESQIIKVNWVDSSVMNWINTE